jgi:hypothetical protein
VGFPSGPSACGSLCLASNRRAICSLLAPSSAAATADEEADVDEEIGSTTIGLFGLTGWATLVICLSSITGLGASPVTVLGAGIAVKLAAPTGSEEAGYPLAFQYCSGVMPSGIGE